MPFYQYRGQPSQVHYVLLQSAVSLGSTDMGILILAMEIGDTKVVQIDR